VGPFLMVGPCRLFHCSVCKFLYVISATWLMTEFVASCSDAFMLFAMYSLTALSKSCSLVSFIECACIALCGGACGIGGGLGVGCCNMCGGIGGGGG